MFEKLLNEKYLVTGGAGFIGSHLCEQILRQRKTVVCVDNLVAGKKENIAEFMDDPRFTFVETDTVDIHLNNPDIFKDVDVVFHNAASKCTVCRDDPRRDLLVNAWGSYSTFIAAQKAGAKKVVHASTGSTLNGNPMSYYGVSKLAGEAYLRPISEYFPGEFNYSILQYYHVYGPRQENSNVGGVIPIFIRNIMEGTPVTIEGDGAQLRHFTYVLDVVNANFLLANTTETNGEKYICRSDVTIPIRELAVKIYGLMSKKFILSYAPTRPGDIKKFKATNEKIKSIGFEFKKDFTDGLIETIKWYQERG